ncbi:MAG: hypothetical protein JNK14_17250 [Chitinophagaceae bacterium]|nr:hypothetical protein [Chitinophagaceae bacterium]
MKFFTQLRPGLIRLFTGACTLVFFFTTMAQNKLPGKAIQVAGGYSRHGSGDLKGIVFGAEYRNYLSKRFSLNYSLRGTINSGKETIIVNNLITGERTDASVRFTTAGVQAGVNGGLSIIRDLKHELMVSLGAFGRYQSASNGDDGYSIYYPQQTSQPTVLIGYDNRTPQEIFTAGGIFQLQYSFTFRNKVFIGLAPGFQTDTNGDVILQAALTAGKRF